MLVLFAMVPVLEAAEPVMVLHAAPVTSCLQQEQFQWPDSVFRAMAIRQAAQLRQIMLDLIPSIWRCLS